MKTAQTTPEGVPAATRGRRLYFADRVYIASVGYVFVRSFARILWIVLFHGGELEGMSFSEYKEMTSSTLNQLTTLALLIGCIFSPFFSHRPIWQRAVMSVIGFLALGFLSITILELALKFGILRSAQ